MPSDREEIHFLKIEDVVALLDVLDIGQIKDPGLIESALHRPKSRLFGIEVYPTLHHKAAVLIDSLVRNHGLLDGNKRLAWTCAFVFLRINGHFLDGGRVENLRFMLSCARGDFSLDEMTHWLVSNSQPV